MGDGGRGFPLGVGRGVPLGVGRGVPLAKVERTVSLKNVERPAMADNFSGKKRT